jgi:hypothetical protein
MIGAAALRSSVVLNQVEYIFTHHYSFSTESDVSKHVLPFNEIILALVQTQEEVVDSRGVGYQLRIAKVPGGQILLSCRICTGSASEA